MVSPPRGRPSAVWRTGSPAQAWLSSKAAMLATLLLRLAEAPGRRCASALQCRLRPRVQAAIDDAIRRITASGKAAGIIATDPAQARRYLDMGCRFVAVGVDVLLLARGARSLRDAFGGGTSAVAPGGVVR